VKDKSVKTRKEKINRKITKIPDTCFIPDIKIFRTTYIVYHSKIPNVGILNKLIYYLQIVLIVKVYILCHMLITYKNYNILLLVITRRKHGVAIFLITFNVYRVLNNFNNIKIKKHTYR